MSDFYQAMHEVLDTSRYDILTGRAVDHQQVIMEAIGRALISLLERVQLRMPDAADYNLEAFTYAFIIVAALLLFGAVMAIVYIIIKRMKHRAGKRVKADIAAIFDDVASKRYTLAELIRMSQDCAQQAQLRDAVRYCYIAVLTALDERQVIRVDKSKTNALLAREIADAAPGFAEPFSKVVDVFQQTWFGKKALDEAGYARFIADAEDMLHEK